MTVCTQLLISYMKMGSTTVRQIVDHQRVEYIFQLCMLSELGWTANEITAVVSRIIRVADVIKVFN